MLVSRLNHQVLLTVREAGRGGEREERKKPRRGFAWEPEKGSGGGRSESAADGGGKPRPPRAFSFRSWGRAGRRWCPGWLINLILAEQVEAGTEEPREGDDGGRRVPSPPSGQGIGTSRRRPASGWEPARTFLFPKLGDRSKSAEEKKHHGHRLFSVGSGSPRSRRGTATTQPYGQSPLLWPRPRLSDMFQGESDPGKGQRPLSSLPNPRASPAHCAGSKLAPQDLVDKHQVQVVAA